MSTTRFRPRTPNLGVGINQFELVGNWLVLSGSGSYAYVIGAYVQFRFSNSQVVLNTDKDTNRGIVAVSMDGGPETLHDLYAPISVRAHQIFDSGFQNGEHIVKMRISGINPLAGATPYCFIEFIDVDDSTLPPAPPPLPPPPGPHSLPNIVAGLGNALRTIAGLRVYNYPPNSVESPAAVISIPETPYDLTTSESGFQWTFDVWVFVGKADDRTAAAKILTYLDSTGISSIRAAIEADRTLGDRCDSVSVLSADPQIASVAGTEYLAIQYIVEVLQ